MNKGHVRHLGGGMLALYEGDTFIREIGVTPGWEYRDRDEFIARYNAALSDEAAPRLSKAQAWDLAYKEIASTPLSQIKGDLYQAVKRRADEILAQQAVGEAAP